MVERTNVPDADRQEQMQPSGPERPGDPTVQPPPQQVSEADLLDQLTPAGPEPDVQLPRGSYRPPEFVPEADALEQATPADREIFEDEE